MIAVHPLDPLTAEEIDAVREAVTRRVPGARFPSVALVEPDKNAVLANRPVPRRALAVVLDDARRVEAVVADGEIESWTELPAGAGQPPILFEEYDRCAETVKADPKWRAAMARRGVTDLDRVFVAPLSAGQFGFADEDGRRMLRSLSFVRCDESDSPWAHPVEGLIAHVDLTENKVVKLIDSGVTPIPAECGNYHPADTLAPLEIGQPEGPGFGIDGHEVSWEGWRFRVSFTAREGLVLHTVSCRGRPVLYRASIPEMVVPYGDPSPSRFWISYFDAGEYLLGKNAGSLRPGCDCLGEIRYLDAVLADDRGLPYTLGNAICLHEEDAGVLWKHEDSVRRSRRLVVSFFTTIGNYDYGFYWHFYLDGTIELEVKATGIVFTGAIEPGAEFEHGTEVAPGLVAPYHQHLFCARLDMSVDGPDNTVEEVDVVPGSQGPYGNAFTVRVTPLTRESEAARMADPAVGRTWQVINPRRTGRLGRPVAYRLVPRPGPVLLAAPGSAVAERAAFATRHLWVTRYDPGQRHPAGDYPNQHAGGAGLPAWVRADRSIEDTDIVLWHTFGPTHIPRTEDWPVMPVERTGFALKPAGFFDRNPALEPPATKEEPCCGT